MTSLTIFRATRIAPPVLEISVEKRSVNVCASRLLIPLPSKSSTATVIFFVADDPPFDRFASKLCGGDSPPISQARISISIRRPSIGPLKEIDSVLSAVPVDTETNFDSTV